MAFDDMNAGAKVYIWNYGGKKVVFRLEEGNVGHASLLAKANAQTFDYLSWWPEGGEGSPGNIAHDRPSGYGKKMKDQTYPQRNVATAVGDQARVTDKEREAASADLKYKFTAGLDFAAMIQFIDELARGQRKLSWFATVGSYNFLNQNCSTAVAHCLRYGGADNFVSWPGHKIWKPTHVAAYCDKLLIAINAAHAGGATKVR